MLIRFPFFFNPDKFPRLAVKKQLAQRGEFNRFLAESAEAALAQQDQPDVETQILDGLLEVKRMIQALAEQGVISRQAETQLNESLHAKSALKKLLY